MAIIATLKPTEERDISGAYSIASIPLNKLVPWDGNVRKIGSSDGIEGLAANIAAVGVLQSLVVRKGVTNMTPEGVTDQSPKESQCEENQTEEGHNIDLDCRPANRKNRDSRPDFGAEASACKQYPRLSEALADYMTTPEDPERVYPSERLVVDVMEAAGGATVEEVIQCLRYLREERGLRPGTKHGPRSFAWFKSVVADHFIEKRNREMVYAPPEVPWDRRNGPGLSQQEFDSMTEAIEVD